MLLPNLHKKESVKIIIPKVLIISILFILLIVMGPQAVLGVELAKHAAYPFYTYTQYVHTYDFIEHIEYFNVIFIFFCVFIKFSIYLYLSSVGFCSFFNAKSNNHFILPICIILLLILLYSGLLKDVILDHILAYDVLPYINGVFIFVIPVFLLIVCFIRKI